MSGDTIESREARVRMEVRHEAEMAAARMAIRRAGFEVNDCANAEDMVRKLLSRNADQKKLEDGLRERLKAAEGIGVFEIDLRFGSSCPFWIKGARCTARQEVADTCICAKAGLLHPSDLTCRLDEGPILVRKAEAAAPGDDFVGISKAVLGYVKGLKAEEEASPESGEAQAIKEVREVGGMYVSHRLRAWLDRRKERSGSAPGEANATEGDPGA